MKPKKLILSPALEARKKELETQLNKISEIEAQEIINQYYPGIKKKFEGKYFKCDNGYNADERWWLYSKVVEIKPDDVYDTNGNGVTSHYTGWQFETTSNGDINITQERYGYTDSLGKQISEMEFNNAWNKMIEKLNKL